MVSNGEPSLMDKFTSLFTSNRHEPIIIRSKSLLTVGIPVCYYQLDIPNHLTTIILRLFLGT